MSYKHSRVPENTTPTPAPRVRWAPGRLRSTSRSRPRDHSPSVSRHVPRITRSGALSTVSILYSQIYNLFNFCRYQRRVTLHRVLRPESLLSESKRHDSYPSSAYERAPRQTFLFTISLRARALSAHPPARYTYARLASRTQQSALQIHLCVCLCPSTTTAGAGVQAAVDVESPLFDVDANPIRLPRCEGVDMMGWDS